MTATAKRAARLVAQREITTTRVFDAPRALVFSLWTDAKHLAAWSGPHGRFTCGSFKAAVDLKPEA